MLRIIREGGYCISYYLTPRNSSDIDHTMRDCMRNCIWVEVGSNNSIRCCAKIFRLHIRAIPCTDFEDRYYKLKWMVNKAFNVEEYL